jgi:hypothetical protein
MPDSREHEATGGGGAAASGGFDFQAAVTAIALTHTLSGSALGWLEGIVLDIPTEVAAETGGAGDDLRLTFSSGEVAEAQIKKGLRGGNELQGVLEALARGLRAGDIHYGVLVIDPNSSRTIGHAVAADIVRLADGPATKLSTQAKRFRQWLDTNGMDVRQTCARLRIVTIPAIAGDSEAVRTSLAHLARVCARSVDAQAAWDRLYREAHLIMARSGSRNLSTVASVLRSAGLVLSSDPSGGPSAILERLCGWTLATTAEYSILGVSKPLPMDAAWLPLTAAVTDQDEETAVADLGAALARYHQGPGHRKETESCDATTIARFRRLAVVCAGPGSGKTTLLKRLAVRSQ